jgi:hypothetical protein
MLPLQRENTQGVKAITPTVAERMVKKAVNIGDAVNVEIIFTR